ITGPQRPRDAVQRRCVCRDRAQKVSTLQVMPAPHLWLVANCAGVSDVALTPPSAATSRLITAPPAGLNAGQAGTPAACRQMKCWAMQGLKVRVAINLSARQLGQDDLADRIRTALERNGLNPSRLTCEITESVAMGDLSVTQRAFDALVRDGVALSIDDFGTGHSSLAYLRKLPATQLKIDRSFVKDVAADDDARAIVDAVVHLAHALGLRVVAECVETQQQREVLLALGCDELQGYLIARPMPAEALVEWLYGDASARAWQAEPTAIVPLAEV